MAPPKISVAIVTYNHEPYIAQALQSALAQQCDAPWEIVVGDDASTDGSFAIIRDFAQRFPQRIRLLDHPRNVGMHRNFLRTVEACQGELVAVLEGDDLWTSPDKLCKQVVFLDSHPNCPACYHPVTVITASNQPTGEVFPGVREPWLSLTKLLRANVIPTGSLMFRRTLLPRLPAKVDQLAMLDWPFVVQLARHGDLGCIDEVMGAYRHHGGGAWSSQSEAARTRHCITALQFLLDEQLVGSNDHAAWSALALWEARQAMQKAQAGHTNSAMFSVIQHLWLCARHLIVPEMRLLGKTLFALVSE